MTTQTTNLKNMTKQQAENHLKGYAKAFLKEAYDFDITIPIVVNNRLSRTLGRFQRVTMMGESFSCRIEISGNMIKYYSYDEVISTLKHECIHYVLFEKGLPFQDGQPLFEKELAKHGSHSSGTKKYKGKVHKYACSNEDCGRQFAKTRKGYEKRYICGKCRSEFVYLGVGVVA